MKRVMPFGKFRGARLADLPDSYLRFVQKLDIYDDLREGIDRELQARYLAEAKQRAKAARKERRRKPTLGEILETNRMCARIVARDPVRYPGLMQEWAAAVLSGRIWLRDPHWTGRRVRAGTAHSSGEEPYWWNNFDEIAPRTSQLILPGGMRNSVTERSARRGELTEPGASFCSMTMRKVSAARARRKPQRKPCRQAKVALIAPPMKEPASEGQC